MLYLINFIRRIRNLWRSVRRQPIDFVRIPLHGALPEFAAPVAWWRKRFLGTKAPLSVSELRRIFERIGDDQHIRGVLLDIDGLVVGSATLMGVYEEILALRARGKRVVAYVSTLDRSCYGVALAADEIIAPLSAQFMLLGMYSEVQYLGDALARYGIQADVQAVSPFKSAYETFTRSEMSPENREQLERMIDAGYQRMLETIGESRGLAVEQVTALIDRAPMSADEAQAARMIDHVLYEDELAAHLQQGDDKPRIVPWAIAKKRLLLPLAKRHNKLIGVVAIEGAIVTGQSRNVPLPIPLIGGEQAGATTTVQALRAAEQNKRIAGIILYVNSPGGDAFASDLIWREVERVKQQKPVVVVMGNVAASGGYYIAAPAARIIAREISVTGSIGVISLRVALTGLLERYDVHTSVLRRGAHSGLSGGFAPLNEDERAAWRHSIQMIYDLFKQRVYHGRGITPEALEPIAGGRVWVGSDALRLGLIDEFGGIPAGLRTAQELAKLPIDPRAPLLLLRGGRGELAPQPFPASPTESLAALLNTLEHGRKPRALAVMPWLGLEDL